MDMQIEIGDNSAADKVPKSQGSSSKKEQKSNLETSGRTNSQYVPTFLQGAAHPGFCMLHLGFKVAALFFYLILGIFMDDKTFCFLIVVILSAMDFWVTKNLTGRILVGLRWWSQIQDDGKEVWYFESLGDKAKASKIDSSVFWIANYTLPILWGIFAITSLLSLQLSQITICLIGAMLGGINLVGYIRCEKNHKSQMSGFLIGQATKNLTAEQMAKIGTTVAGQMAKK